MSLKEAATGCYQAQVLDALLPGAVRMELVVWGNHGRLLEHEVLNNYKARHKSIDQARHSTKPVDNTWF